MLMASPGSLSLVVSWRHAVQPPCIYNCTSVSLPCVPAVLLLYFLCDSGGLHGAEWGNCSKQVGVLPCAGRDLDLRQCYKIVQSHGGYDAATSQKLWRRIAKKLGVDTDVITNASYVLK